MGRLEAFGVCAGLIWMAAAASAGAAPRGSFFAPGNAPHAPEIMLYFNHAVGGGAGGGSLRPTFGLRVQQVHLGSNTGDPDQANPMQHRELLNWQMEGRPGLHLSNMRVKLGNRVTYDLTTQRFGSPSTRSAIQLGTPTLRNSMPSFAPPRPGTAPTPRDTNKDNSSMHEIAVAAMAALAPARFTPAQRQIAQRQGGITGIVALQRMQAAASR